MRPGISASRLLCEAKSRSSRRRHAGCDTITMPPLRPRGSEDGGAQELNTLSGETLRPEGYTRPSDSGAPASHDSPNRRPAIRNSHKRSRISHLISANRRSMRHLHPGFFSATPDSSPAPHQLLLLAPRHSMRDTFRLESTLSPILSTTPSFLIATRRHFTVSFYFSTGRQLK
jgi:hypothetical protein